MGRGYPPPPNPPSINLLLNDPNYAYIEFQDIFKAVVDRHAPLKTKEIRGNQARFINKELEKYYDEISTQKYFCKA